MSHLQDLAREHLRPESQVESLEISAAPKLRGQAQRWPAKRGKAA